VLHFNQLKKLYKAMAAYFLDKLNVDMSSEACKDVVPNLNAIAKEHSKDDVLKFVQLTVALAVQCDKNQEYIARIQTLSQECQHHIMLSIEQVM
jgi:protein HOOK3